MALLHVICHECLYHDMNVCHYMKFYFTIDEKSNFLTIMEILDTQYPSLCSQTMYFSISN